MKTKKNTIDNTIVRTVFVNKSNGQHSITLPKKKLLELFQVDKMPTKIEISMRKVKQ